MSFLFVTLIAAVLAGPSLLSADGDDPPACVTPSPETEATSDPRRSPPSPPSPDTAPERLLNRYPRECLRPVARRGGGLVAAYTGKAIKIVTTAGNAVATITDVAPVVRPPVSWSPSGRYLAAGPKGLFWDADGEVVLFANGEFAHGMVSSRAGRWAWSPIADCGVALQDGGLYATTIDPAVTGPGVQLVADDVVTFSFSPNGRKLHFVSSDGSERSIWTANLMSGAITSGMGFRRRVCTTCSPGGDFRVRSRSGRLALLDANGDFLRNLTEVQTDNGVWRERRPEWGPGDTGVLFVRCAAPPAAGVVPPGRRLGPSLRREPPARSRTCRDVRLERDASHRGPAEGEEKLGSAHPAKSAEDQRGLRGRRTQNVAPSSWDAIDPDLAAVGFDDRTRQVETEARAGLALTGWVEAAEPLEQLLLVCIRDPGPFVDDRDPDGGRLR